MEDQNKKWPQYLTGLLACIPMLCTGTVISWTSPAIDYLLKEAVLTNHEVSWIASITGLGAVLGTIPASYTACSIGRKKSLLLFSTLFVLGWLIVILSKNKTITLCVARFISGVAIGACMVIIPFYNEEISQVDIRGTLGYYVDFMTTVGYLYTYVLAIFLSYFWLTVMCMVPAIVFLIAFSWMPESPLYLLSKGNDREAVEAIKFFRGNKHLSDMSVQEEIFSFREHLLEDKGEATNVLSKCNLVKQCLLFTRQTCNTVKAMRIMFALVVLAKTTGVEGIVYYSVEIYEKGKSTVSPSVCNAILGVVQCLVSLFSAFSIDKIGRRQSLLISAFGMTFSTALLMMHFALLNTVSYIDKFGWVPCFSLTLLLSAYSVGLAPGPWLLMAELIPTQSKSWVGAMCISIGWASQFAVSCLFGLMFYNLSDVVTYGICLLMCIISFVFVLFKVPETKNKTRSEIQSHLSSENSNRI